MVNIGNDWDEILKDEFEKDYYKNEIREVLKRDYQTKIVYPDMYDIFNAFKYTSFEDTKIVILGQDPYHNPGQAHGLSFSVKRGINPPPSLKNIYKEIQDDIGCEMDYNNGDLTYLTKQGVLLLNASLTVIKNSPNSHSKIGWERFTNNVIDKLNDKKTPIVYLLWGRNAQIKESLITNKNHYILKAPHPSPFSARTGFFGCKHFSKTNQFLQDNDLKPINWCNIGV